MGRRILWGLVIVTLAAFALTSALLFAADLADTRCEDALGHGAAAYAAMKDIQTARAINAACPSERAQAFYATLSR